MKGNQPADSQIVTSLNRGRVDWWGFLRGVILLFSSLIGVGLLYSIWIFLRG